MTTPDPEEERDWEDDWWYSPGEDRDAIEAAWSIAASELEARVQAGEDVRTVGEEIRARMRRERAERKSGQAGERGE